MDQKRSALIKEILYGYVQQRSISNSIAEKDAEMFFIDFFSRQEYFRKNKEFLATFPIPQDRYNRAVCWAMVKGDTPDTVVVIHHNDVVTASDFKSLREFAFSPDQLREKLLAIKDCFADEVRNDLTSGQYIFGRGVCDMKGGAAIQMALLCEYAQYGPLQGNVLLLALPDEENLSAGMRAAIPLLNNLQEKYGLQYRLMINSEPHQRKNSAEGIFSFGSIGKIMPAVSVRGFSAHAGKGFEGLSPVSVMAEIVRRTESNMDFSDSIEGEAAPPPTWLYLRDSKAGYDVSMPPAVNGCLSILSFHQSPDEILAKIKQVCEQSFTAVLKDLAAHYKKFLHHTRQQQRALPWTVKVCYFGEVYNSASKKHGENFTTKYKEYIKNLKKEIDAGRHCLISANFKLIDFVCDHTDDLSPQVIISLVPPYYPNVSNLFYDKDKKISSLYNTLQRFVEKKYGQTYSRENFYTGISDLSYSCIDKPEEIEQALATAMPLWGDIYHLPIKEIENIAMPCVNIGPWGKDFHKVTERVYIEDLLERTPAILDYAIRHMVG